MRVLVDSPLRPVGKKRGWSLGGGSLGGRQPRDCKGYQRSVRGFGKLRLGSKRAANVWWKACRTNHALERDRQGEPRIKAVATSTAATAARYCKQHFLYFFPLLHGHGSL